MIAVPKWIEFCRGNGEIVKPWILKFEVKFTRLILPTTFEAADEYTSSKGEICNHYEKLFLTKAFADLQFEIAGKKLMAHKCILSGKSFLQHTHHLYSFYLCLQPKLLKKCSSNKQHSEYFFWRFKFQQYDLIFFYKSLFANLYSSLFDF
jgi:hypothetical protein